MKSTGMHCIYGCLHVQGSQAAPIAVPKDCCSWHVSLLSNSWNVIQKAGNVSAGPLTDCMSWQPSALILACNDAVAVDIIRGKRVIGHDRASAEAAIGVLCQQMPTLPLWALQGACQQRGQDQYHHGK